MSRSSTAHEFAVKMSQRAELLGRICGAADAVVTAYCLAYEAGEGDPSTEACIMRLAELLQAYRDS
jgi:hypothetical protein